MKRLIYSKEDLDLILCLELEKKDEEIEDMQKEIERLKIIEEKYKDSQLYIHDFKDEIERLNNIINGMEEFFKYELEEEVRPLNDFKVSVWTICLEKLQELKGDGSNE